MAEAQHPPLTRLHVQHETPVYPDWRLAVEFGNAEWMNYADFGEHPTPTTVALGLHQLADSIEQRFPNLPPTP